nr:MAG TPA: hypothetical protein [Caudoviricetes sp.]
MICHNNFLLLFSNLSNYVEINIQISTDFFFFLLYNILKNIYCMCFNCRSKWGTYVTYQNVYNSN